MIFFLRGLFIDLRNRINKNIVRLDNLSLESRTAKDFKSKTLALLKGLRQRIESFIDGGTLEIDFFLSNNISEYNSINNRFLEIELFRYLPISKYESKAFGYFEKLIERIYNDIQCLQSIPFISTISNSDSYYWAYPKYNMIALPQDEEDYLLNLSDLYHEIGHLIYQQSKTYLTGEYTNKMQSHYHFEKQRLLDEGVSTKYIDDLIEAEKHWLNSWSEEFACDLIATYLVGPAYAWTNLKICTVSSEYNAVYSSENLFRQHPPDEARMRVIFKMLGKLGFQTELLDITITWEKFLSEIKNTKPDSYDFIFNDSLLDSITTNVYEGCQNIALRSYSEQISKISRPVSLVINEAWEKIRHAPDSFQDWEILEIGKMFRYNA